MRGFETVLPGLTASSVMPRLTAVGYLFFVFVIFPLNLYGVENDWDMVAKSGVTLGSIERPTEDDEIEKKDIGGLALNFGFEKDLTNRYSQCWLGEVLLDIPNQSVSRMGALGGVSWHVLGGSKEIIDGGDEIRFRSANSTQASVFGRAGIFHYSAASKDLTTQISGSTFEIRSGFQYRRSTDSNDSYGGELGFTILSLPASAERLTSSSISILGFWRF